MTEKLFQYIWQFQHFNFSQLKSEQGENIQIIDPGTLNRDQGPDFLSASIKIADTVWFGNVELHLLSSDWFKHEHHLDNNYKNVILHVVCKNDHPLTAPPVPVLELQSRISLILLDRYSDWMSAPHSIPCEQHIASVPRVEWKQWTAEVLKQRLERKAEYIFALYNKTNHHWIETFWWMLARNFGIRVNAEAFESIARSIPVKILTRHKDQVIVIESLLFGQAGLLDRKFTEEYPGMLQKEYRHYRKKYLLKKTFVSLKFLRMRPSSFPSIRLAQLAMLISRSSHLFSKVIESANLTELLELFTVTANDYWHYHYHFDEPSDHKEKKLGNDMIENILINTVAPIIYAYGIFQQDKAFSARAVSLLESLSAEQNRVSNNWLKMNIPLKNAAETQSVLELNSRYCDYKRCLECGIGKRILDLG
ncbi:MAG: DUF2851 family protein [Chitinophagaceae bacterium]